MVAIMQQAKEIYHLYNGNSLYMTFFLCALFYLWLSEKEKGKRILLVYASVCLLALFFFPLSSYLIRFILDGETYYRLLWFVPVCIVTAYSAVKLIAGQEKMIKKVIIFIMAILMLLSCGDYTYDNPTFEPAENAYHIPQTVVDICDEIMPESEEVWVSAVMPQELLSYVRQYTALIHMPYGRAVLIERWNLGHPLHDTMEAEVIDAAVLAEQAREYGCHYIVLKDTRAMEGKLEDYDYLPVSDVDGYHIYLDKYNSRGL